MPARLFFNIQHVSIMSRVNLKLNGFILSAAILFGVIHYWIIPIPVNYQWIFCGLTILLTGVPHGALDHLVAKKNCDLSARNFSSFGFYLKYFSKIALFGLCWYFFPAASMLIFLFLSAFHFGETDLPIRESACVLKPFMLQTSYGLFLLAVMIVVHQSEILPLISQLAGVDTALLSRILNDEKSRILMVSIPLLMLLGVGSFFVIRQKPSLTWVMAVLFQTFTILAVLVLLPLPLAFAFYFGCWHSLNSLSSIRAHLSSSMGRSISWTWMIQQLLPYSVLALAGIAILIILVFNTGYIQFPLLAGFIGLALLTAPHLEVMSEMYKMMRK